MPKYITRPQHISLTGNPNELQHVILPLPPSSPRHKGCFIVEKHQNGNELIFWEPLRAKRMTPLEAAAVVLSRLAEAARAEKTLDLKSVFQKYDADGGGSIDQEELGHVLTEFHVLLTEEELTQVFSIFDPDGGGEISYLEFVYAIFNRRAFIKKLEQDKDKLNEKIEAKKTKNKIRITKGKPALIGSNNEETNNNEAYAYFKKAKQEEAKKKNANAAVSKKKKLLQLQDQQRKKKLGGIGPVTYMKEKKNKRKPNQQKIRGVNTPQQHHGRHLLQLMVHAGTGLHNHDTEQVHRYIYEFMNKHKLRTGDLFRFADERSRSDIMSDFYGEIDVKEFIKLVRHCEKEMKTEMPGNWTTEMSNQAIVLCFNEMDEDGQGAVEINELDEFVRQYRIKLGKRNTAERTRAASIPLLQLGYSHSIMEPHVSPRTFSRETYKQNSIRLTDNSESRSRSNSSHSRSNSTRSVSKKDHNFKSHSRLNIRRQKLVNRATPPTTPKRPLKSGTFVVREGRMSISVHLSNSPRRLRKTVDIDAVKLGKTVNIKNIGVADDKDKTESEILGVLEVWMDLHILRIKDAFSEMDINNSGGLSPLEFMSVFMKLGAQISREQMSQLFKHVDDDGSGDITLVELRRHIRRRRTIAKRDGMNRLAERVVIEGGTKFKTVQFTDYEKYTSIEAANLVLMQIQKAVQLNPELNLKTVFRNYDSDGGGSIDKIEFNGVLLAFHIQLTDKEVNNVFDIFDPEGDGDISYLEFVYAVKNRADFIRRLEIAEKQRLVKEKINDTKFYDDPTKIVGKVVMDRAEMEEQAMEWMKRTSEHIK